MFVAVLFGLWTSVAGAQINHRTGGAEAKRGSLHVAFALYPDLSKHEVRATHLDLLTLVLAQGKGELHRAPDAKSGYAVVGTDGLEGLRSLRGVELISANGRARDGMQVGEYRVAMSGKLSAEQSRELAARMFELAQGKLIANVTHHQRLGQFTARIPRANLALIRGLDGITAVTPSGADALARRSCEPDFY